jgi:hypothetical protein
MTSPSAGPVPRSGIFALSPARAAAHPAVITVMAHDAPVSELPEAPPAGPWQLVVRDGSANRWTLDGVGVTAQYAFDPVQPDQSSTGHYSVGTPAQGTLDATVAATLWTRVRGLLLDTGVQVPDRAKGTVLVRLQLGGVARAAIVRMGVADDIIASLRAL